MLKLLKYKQYIIRNFIVFFVLLLFQFSAKSQKPDLKFKYITIADGLSQSQINCIMQDKKGFMWFGTQDGLNMYNGYEVKTYMPEFNNPNSVHGKNIQSIIEDSKGNIWVGTWTNGINKFSHKTGVFSSYNIDTSNLDSPHNQVLCIYETKKGELWVGSHEGGLNIFNPILKSFKSYFNIPSDNKSLSNNIVQTIEESSSGNLWIGTQNGLNLFDSKNNNFKRFQVDPKDNNSISNNVINDIYCDKDGIIWLATENGLNRLDEKTMQFVTYFYSPENEFSISDNNITCFYEDHLNRLWIGTLHGLNLYDKKTNRFYNYLYDEKKPNSLNDNQIISICEDMSGVMWIGTKSGGVNWFESIPKGFKYYCNIPNDPESLSKNYILSIYDEDYEHVWIGTIDGGLNLLNRKTGKFKAYTFDPKDRNSISDNRINCILKDRDGTLWIGTKNGLNTLDSSRKKFKKFFPDPLNENSISCEWTNTLYEDKEGKIWIGTRDKGVSIYDKSKRLFTHINTTDGLSDNRIRSITEDYSGIIWIGTMFGITKYDRDKGEFTQIYSNSGDTTSLSSNVVLSVFEDKSNRMWISTVEGLNLYHPEDNTFTRFFVKDGLPNNVIYATLEDNSGNIWLSTNKGISRYNPETKQFRNYDVYDGLQGNEFNYGASFKNKNGEMYFGGTNGFNIFHPDSINHNKYIPPVLISDFKLFNKSVPVGKNFNGRVILNKTIYSTEKIVLTHSDNIISFEFIALSYISPEKNQYAYMLEGLETNWNYVGNRRFATYSTLPPDEYTFRVKASNNDGEWNNTGASIKIIIKPPYWETWWFRISIALFLLLVIIASYRLRLRSIKIQNKKLENLVKRRTHDLYEVNTQLEENQTDLELKQEEIAEQRDAIALQNKELEKLSIVARETDNAVVIADSKGNIEWVNEGFSRIYDYTLEELKDAGYSRLQELSKNISIMETINFCLKYKKSKNYESLNHSKSGNDIWTQTTLTPIVDENKNVIKLVAIDSNISKLKFAEIEILQQKDEIKAQRDFAEDQNKLIEEQNKELEKHRYRLESLVKERTSELEAALRKAEESDKLKSAFLANMSHEIRTPMNAIIGFSSLLNDNDLTEDVREELITHIEHNSNTLLRLIDDIIDIAKIEAGQLEINKKECQINKILYDLVKTYEDRKNVVYNKDIHLQLNLGEPNIGFLISTDTVRIQQIFTNLIDNALKFTEKGTIEIGYSIENKTNNPIIVFYVKDTGIGLPKDQQKSIFTRFTKIETDRKKLYRGAGLGLTICKNITELLGGEIWVESELNKGSTFYFSIPFVEMTKKNNLEQQQTGKYNWNNKTILIAEDENSNFNLLELILSNTRVKIVRAFNGNEVLKILKKVDPIDLILMDIKMPEMDGLETTKHIREFNKKIPIIAQTAYAMADDEKISLEAGCNAYISKPIKKPELLEIISKLLYKP